MKCSEYIKSRGLKSLRFLSEQSGASERTLQNWYEKKRKLFDIIVNGVVNMGDIESYSKHLKKAKDEGVFIYRNDECKKGDFVYSVDVPCTCFWLDSFRTKEEAEKFCEYNGIKIIAYLGE